MASLRDIRKRIKSVKSTQKITKAMKMVAAARLRRAQEAAEQANPYAKAIQQLLGRLAQDAAAMGHPLMKLRQEQKRVYVVMSSDRGLCGAFNSGLFRKFDAELRQDPAAQAVLIGRKALAYYGRKQRKSLKSFEQFWTEFSFESAKQLADTLVSAFTSGECDEVYLVYNEFVSVMSQKPTVERLLPMQPEGETAASNENGKEYAYEPNKQAIITELISKALYTQVYRACLHSQASEFGARMAAMDNASRNAGEMIDSLTLTMNRVRQANITRELVEIISGAEAIH